LVLHGYWTYLRALFTGFARRIFQIRWKLATTINVVFLAPIVTALIFTLIFLSLLSNLPSHYQVLAGLGCLAGTQVLIWAVLMKRMFARFLLWGITLYFDMGGLSKRIDFALPEYDALLDRVAEHVAREIEDEPHRQFVLVGHSAGAILAIEVAGRLLERLADRDGAKPIRLVTLGGAWAILSALNGERAVRHRATVAKLLSAPSIEWADIVSPRDVLSISDTKVQMPIIIRRHAPIMINFEYVNPKYKVVFKKESRLTNAVNVVQMHLQYLLIPTVTDRYNYLNMIFNPWGDSIRSFVNQRDR
jgi:pimeloyl-ACP methyl ester carboxylesterase